MDMNKAFFLRKEDNEQPDWCIIDAKGQVLGRLATLVADRLRGKDLPTFTPHTASGRYVVVINASEIVLTGNKMEDKEYARYTGWIGGLKIKKAKNMKTEDIITHAVKGMLPKNRLSRQLERHLRVYSGSVHPHAAQKPE